MFSKKKKKGHHSTQEMIVIVEPSITLKQDMMQIDDAPPEPEWATNVIQYLKNELLPEDKA